MVNRPGSRIGRDCNELPPANSVVEFTNPIDKPIIRAHREGNASPAFGTCVGRATLTVTHAKGGK